MPIERAILQNMKLPKKLMKSFAQPVEDNIMKLTKSHLKQLIKEAAAEYVWGVKNPGRVANQYTLQESKAPVTEAARDPQAAAVQQAAAGMPGVPAADPAAADPTATAATAAPIDPNAAVDPTAAPMAKKRKYSK